MRVHLGCESLQYLHAYGAVERRGRLRIAIEKERKIEAPEIRIALPERYRVGRSKIDGAVVEHVVTCDSDRSPLEGSPSCEGVTTTSVICPSESLESSCAKTSVARVNTSTG